MSVQRSQSSVVRGQQASYLVQVSTRNNASASGVSVALAVKPSSLKPAFASNCAKGAGTAGCTVSAVSDKAPVNLNAKVPVASGAASVTSVTLTATASISTTAKWTPPAAAVTVAVTSASAGPASASVGAAAGAPGSTVAGISLPLGPVPAVGNVSTSLIGPGNAAGLFPSISPSATPDPAPGGSAPPGPGTGPVTSSSPLAFAQPGLTGQAAGLIALAFAILLTVTRLSLRRRFRPRKRPGQPDKP